MGLLGLILSHSLGGVIPLLVGAGLMFLGWFPGRTGLVVFGHACIVLGCVLVTWGIYLVPVAKPDLAHVLTWPLFWGLISILGGICANFHGFCSCVRKQK